MRRGVQLIQKPMSAHTGIGRYFAELERGLADHAIESIRVPLRTPVPRAVASIARRAGYDLTTFFSSYPLRAQTRSGYLTHLTSQTLGALLLTQRLPRPVVVTVHDILPYLLRKDRSLSIYRTSAQRMMDAIAMRGLKRADRLIADSHYTKSTLVDALDIPEERINVVHLGVDNQCFRPAAVPAAFRARHSLPNDRPYILFVGSEDPRKNLRLLFKAFARVRQEVPDAMLLKVGAAAFDKQRSANLRLCADLGIAGAVRFFDEVPEDDLPNFYRLASVLAFPSLYEGFGFPVLEALASGTPVVAADVSSIPELVGDAATLINGTSVDAFVSALTETLRSGVGDVTARVAQAATFSWSRTIESTLATYLSVGATCGELAWT
jgi:glycosyltransferase involved in cell wall biosynthesis